ncbi:MAG: hypothetical protein K1X79_14320 [Oligoflexia bacterium]|nr:hypothetical protein [Oligoflexia bacterium]
MNGESAFVVLGAVGYFLICSFLLFAVWTKKVTPKGSMRYGAPLFAGILWWSFCPGDACLVGPSFGLLCAGFMGLPLSLICLAPFITGLLGLLASVEVFLGVTGLKNPSNATLYFDQQGRFLFYNWAPYSEGELEAHPFLFARRLPVFPPDSMVFVRLFDRSETGTPQIAEVQISRLGTFPDRLAALLQDNPRGHSAKGLSKYLHSQMLKELDTRGAKEFWDKEFLEQLALSLSKQYLGDYGAEPLVSVTISP